jgi:hypothetical protein
MYFWELSLLIMYFNLTFGYVRSMLPIIHIISFIEAPTIYGKYNKKLKNFIYLCFSFAEIKQWLLKFILGGNYNYHLYQCNIFIFSSISDV